MFISFTNFIIHFVCKGIIHSRLATLIHDSVLAAGLVVKTGSDYVEAAVAEAREANASASMTAQSLNNEIKNEVETTSGLNVTPRKQKNLQLANLEGCFVYIGRLQCNGQAVIKVGHSAQLKGRIGKHNSMIYFLERQIL